MLARKGSSRLRPISVVVSSNQVNYGLFAACSSPTDKVAVTCTINPGVACSGTFVIASFAAGSTVLLINRGQIEGPGGDGGNNPPAASGGGGNDGIDAMIISVPGVKVSIDNGAGYVRGGGGGGGGGAGGGSSGRGGGGGGGIGNPGGDGGGVAGSYGAGPGNSGDSGGIGGQGDNDGARNVAYRGGDGGQWGEPGNPGMDAPHGGLVGGLGGAAGKAVRLANGASAPTWIAGFNPTQVKGAIGT